MLGAEVIRTMQQGKPRRQRVHSARGARRQDQSAADFAVSGP
jgi:hypothetical protein